MQKYKFEESIGKLSQEVSKGLGQLLEVAFAKNGLKVSSREWIVLSYLYNSSNVTQSDLVIPLGRDKVAVKRLIDLMEGRDLVCRQNASKDKRFNQITLTQEGTQLYLKLEPIVEKYMSFAMQNIENENFKTTLKVLDQLNSNIKKYV